ncbi:hypothetical protein O3P69_013504 [Scylla paramamosain]|uniref:C2H2-type domain-containing protein n=1 Tax=Scylla paramamosain TaxID=85552 RepID=A0AAW0SAW6_SCYPA
MHGKPVHTCTYCEERFCVRSDLMRHINAHHTAQNAYICAEPLCSEAFPTSDALRYHRNKVHSTETYTCTHCSKVYKWKGELRTHIQRAHACRERFSCPLCARSYADKRKLRQHLSVKHGSEGLDKQPEGGVGFSEDPATTTTTTTTTINENYDQETFTGRHCVPLQPPGSPPWQLRQVADLQDGREEPQEDSTTHTP